MSSGNHYILYFTVSENQKSSHFREIAVENSRQSARAREERKLKGGKHASETISRDYAGVEAAARRRNGAAAVERCGRGG
jgi:hypothetical protein